MMSDESSIPSTARCLKCGYLLRGLPTTVCPECGRAFDASDAATYDLSPPGWRRRWWIRRGLVLGVLMLLLVALSPRGLLRGQLTFRCRTCGTTQTTSRWELLPPRWLGFRYPGHAHTAFTPGAADVVPPCIEHTYRVDIKFQTRVCLSASGMGLLEEGEAILFNGFVTTPSTAPQALKHVMQPENNGIHVGPSLVP